MNTSSRAGEHAEHVCLFVKKKKRRLHRDTITFGMLA